MAVVAVTTYQYRYCAQCDTRWASRRSNYVCDTCKRPTSMTDPHILTWMPMEPGVWPGGKWQAKRGNGQTFTFTFTTGQDADLQ